MEYDCLAVPQGLIQGWSYFGRKYLFHCLTRLLLWFASASLICVFSFQRTVSAQHIIWNKGNLAAPSVFTSSQLALRCQYSFSNIFHVFLILPNYTEAALNQSKPLPSAARWSSSLVCLHLHWNRLPEALLDVVWLSLWGLFLSSAQRSKLTEQDTSQVRWPLSLRNSLFI